ncbi:hypothetical protein C7B80_13065 [Cyanosarcina cf. burmensis CCALA 770]|nr:hypothetical protein C7B80_13065 [Cyanosarcina cf. burmensis CCALA 770]
MYVILLVYPIRNFTDLPAACDWKQALNSFLQGSYYFSSEQQSSLPAGNLASFFYCIWLSLLAESRETRSKRNQVLILLI